MPGANVNSGGLIQEKIDNRIITIAPDTQLVVYDALVDPGVSVPDFVKTWIIGKSLHGVITALRDRTELPQGRYAF